MSEEMKKEPVVDSKAPEELATEELNNVNGGGFLQDLGQATKSAQGDDKKVKYLNVTMDQTFIS